MKTLLIFLSLVLIAKCQLPNLNCKENEEARMSGPCEPDCKNNFERSACPRSLVYRCFCKEGFVRNNNNRECVLREDCPSCDSWNEVYKECGSFLEPSCRQPDLEIADVIDPNACIKGCFCKDGYVRAEDVHDECIKKEDCPIQE